MVFEKRLKVRLRDVCGATSLSQTRVLSPPQLHLRHVGVAYGKVGFQGGRGSQAQCERIAIRILENPNLLNKKPY